MRIAIYPRSLASHGAKALRDALKAQGHRAKLVRSDGTFEPRSADLIIGWGNSDPPNWGQRALGRTAWYNLPANIPNAVNKRRSFQMLAAHHVSTPEFTEDADAAKKWLAAGKCVIGRQRLEASRGEGIVQMDTLDQFQPCPLYTKWKSADREYRVYVFRGRVVDYLQKKKPNGAGDLGVIRSAANGWVYCRTDIKPLPEAGAAEAVKAVAALGLDFGGVDILWGNKSGARVLEVNTAPGIEGVGAAMIARSLTA